MLDPLWLSILALVILAAQGIGRALSRRQARQIERDEWFVGVVHED